MSRTVKATPYRIEDGRHVIDVSLSDVSLLFSTLDPSPVRERDLDPSTDDFIMEATREIGSGAPMKIVFHIPEDQTALAERARVPEATANYFTYRAWATGMALERLLRQGWVSLAIGLSFLALCLGVRAVMPGHLPDAAGAIVGEGLLILGWVAMWRPTQLFLYDWWPLWQQRRIYTALSRTPVDCRPMTAAAKPFLPPDGHSSVATDRLK